METAIILSILAASGAAFSRWAGKVLPGGWWRAIPARFSRLRPRMEGEREGENTSGQGNLHDWE